MNLHIAHDAGLCNYRTCVKPKDCERNSEIENKLNAWTVSCSHIACVYQHLQPKTAITQSTKSASGSALATCRRLCGTFSVPLASARRSPNGGSTPSHSSSGSRPACSATLSRARGRSPAAFSRRLPSRRPRILAVRQWRVDSELGSQKRKQTCSASSAGSTERGKSGHRGAGRDGIRTATLGRPQLGQGSRFAKEAR